MFWKSLECFVLLLISYQKQTIEGAPKDTWAILYSFLMHSFLPLVQQMFRILFRFVINSLIQMYLALSHGRH